MSDFKNYANSFQTVINLSLKRISRLLEYMGNPHLGLNYIHVAGTNAKGSVCAFLQTALTHSGKKTGKYISPNLVRVNERITVDGEEIPENSLNSLLSEAEKASEKVLSEINEHPSQFEIWTAVAFSYFKKMGCDVVVLETGLGGRFDATNVIKENILSIITRIALDHTEYLGDTYEKIAFEKCGIIKKGSPVVTVNQTDEALSVIKERAKEENSALYIADAPLKTNHNLIYERYNDGEFDVFLSLGGMHQLENASIAVKALKVLGVAKESIEYGLTHAENNARFQLVEKNPPVIFDGGHNPDGITALKNSLDLYFPNTKKVFICAFMKDKDIEASLKIIKDCASEICFVPVLDNERAAKETQLTKESEKAGIPSKWFDDAGDALKYAKTKNQPVIICGSLYLYKDMEKFFS